MIYNEDHGHHTEKLKNMKKCSEGAMADGTRRRHPRPSPGQLRHRLAYHPHRDHYTVRSPGERSHDGVAWRTVRVTARTSDLVSSRARGRTLRADYGLLTLGL